MYCVNLSSQTVILPLYQQDVCMHVDVCMYVCVFVIIVRIKCCCIHPPSTKCMYAWFCIFSIIVLIHTYIPSYMYTFIHTATSAYGVNAICQVRYAVSRGQGERVVGRDIESKSSGQHTHMILVIILE